jgi:predicted TIM-barrel fold metal-dependent hydrolase
MTTQLENPMSALPLLQPGIDCDSHVLEPADMWQNYIDPEFRDRALRVDVIEGTEVLFADNEPFLAGRMAGLGGSHIDRSVLMNGNLVYEDGRLPASYDPKARLDLFRDWGLHGGLVFPTIGILPFNITDDRLMNAYSTAYNRWMSEFLTDAGPQVLAVAQVNMRDLDSAILEVERAAAAGFKAIFVPPELVDDRLLSDPTFDLFWQTCADLSLPICLHVVVRFGGAGMPFAPWMIGGAGRLFSFTLSSPGQLIPAVTNMILGGVFDRVPDLKVIVVEAGVGWVPYLMDRLEEKNATLGGPLHDVPLALRPSEYLQRNCWFVAEPNERTIGSALDLVGQDRILWGSDFPHIDSTMTAVSEIKASLASLSSTQQNAVFGDNARALFNI